MEQMEQRMMMSASPHLTATPYSASQINLAWTDSSPATGYVVQEWIPGTTVELPNGSVKMTKGVWTQLPFGGNGPGSDSVGGLSYDTSYTFRVGAEYQGATTWSNSVSATTGILVDHPAASTAYANVSGTLWGPANEPSFLDVHQGGQGDCGLMASLAEVAYRDPQDIKNMFTPYGTTVENGITVNLYTVRFFTSRGTAEYVTVDTELPGGGGTYAHPANGVLWPSLAEKAYAQAYALGYVSVATQSNPPPKDSYASLVMWPSSALQAITGSNQGDVGIDPSKIPAAWKAGNLVVLTTSNKAASAYIVGDVVQTSSGPDSETHCYAVINSPTTYTASSATASASPVTNFNTSATSTTLPFEVYNPWGTNSSGWAMSTFHGKNVYGLFTANASFLSSNFAQQSFASGAAAGDETGGVKARTLLAAEAARDLVLAGWGI
jgi:hypothetical protein